MDAAPDGPVAAAGAAAGAAVVPPGAGAAVTPADGTPAGGEPAHRLTRIAATAVEAAGEHPEASGREHAVVMVVEVTVLPDGETAEVEHGLATCGFSEGEAGLAEVVDFMLTHVQALCELIGRPIQIVDTSQN